MQTAMQDPATIQQKEIVDNLLVRIHLIIEMMLVDRPFSKRV